MKNWRISTTISLYFENGKGMAIAIQWKRNRNSYVMVAFSMTFNDPNLDFKVMPILEVKYGINGPYLGQKEITNKNLHPCSSV